MRYIGFLIFLFIQTLGIAQDFSNRWKGHFSFNTIVDLHQSGTKIYAAAQNSIFIYDLETKSNQILSTIEGLSGEAISAIYHSESFNTTLLGYENGLVELITPEGILAFVAIVDQVTIPPDQKRINSFTASDNLVYIATQFGIVQFNLERLEFGDTYFIGSGGSQIEITGVAVVNDQIYASSLTQGILSADSNNPNLVDFNQWQNVSAGSFSNILEFNGNIIVWQEERVISRLNNTLLEPIFTAEDDILDMYASESSITVSTNNEIISLNQELQVSEELSVNQVRNAIQIDDQKFIGTFDRGLLLFDSSSNGLRISPDGPLFNVPFRIEAAGGTLWVTFGEFDNFYNPFPLNERGISKLNNEQWNAIPFTDLQGARSLANITINPNNENQIFISSFADGLVEINADEVIDVYKNDVGFEVFAPEVGLYLMNGSAFDRNGNLWITNSRVENGLQRFSTSDLSSTGIDLIPVVPSPESNLGFSDTVINDSGQLFLGAYDEGVIGYDPNTEEFLKIKGISNGMPSDYVTALEVDRENQLWIGTTQGLRVLFSSSNAFRQDNPTAEQIIILDDEGVAQGLRVLFSSSNAFRQDNPSAEQIIILDDEGVAQELLFEQNITDIEADGSDDKWVATASSGVFYLSSDGQETKAHFTIDNSPLPSNNVLDIAINDDTGAVYFATDRGLVEFQSTATGPEQNLENVIAFPNPVRPGYRGQVTIRGLTADANVKITDIQGNLVFEQKSPGGSVQWDTTAFGRHKVASGVYLILITGEDNAETTVSKLLIVR